MIIEVKPYRGVNKKNNIACFRIELCEKATVKDAISKMDIKKGTALAFVVNNKKANLQTKLSDGDELKLIPIVGGG